MAMRKEFEAFLDEQVQEEQETKTDWEKIKFDWIDSINSFYVLVEDMLGKYIKSGKVSIEYIPYIMQEDNLGSYDTKKLILTLGTKQVTFEPIGRLIFGAQGRIDMEGVSGKVKFIFTSNNSKNEAIAVSLIINGRPANNNTPIKEKLPPSWKISTPPPHLQYIDISEESFFDALMEVVNG
jgi:hypothetical protein